MGISIIKHDSRGAYRLVAEHDLYLDQAMTKVIVVKVGEDVPKEAAFVLTGKGGTIPPRYVKLLEKLEAKVEETESVPAAPEPLPPAPDAAPADEPTTTPQLTPEVNVKLEPKATKVKK